MGLVVYSGVAMTAYRSLKALAWSTAASYLQDAMSEETGLDPVLVDHVIKAVIPAMRRRAQIIERNQKKG